MSEGSAPDAAAPPAADAPARQARAARAAHPEWVGRALFEGVLIVLSVVLGFAISEWRDPRAARGRAEQALLERPEWGWLAGRPVWALDANAYLSRPGPRLVDGVELLAALLHPAAVGAPAASAAARIV